MDLIPLEVKSCDDDLPEKTAWPDAQGNRLFETGVLDKGARFGRVLEVPIGTAVPGDGKTMASRVAI